MATQAESDAMRAIEIAVNLWKSQKMPAWRAIQVIAETILEFQKAEWKREHE